MLILHFHFQMAKEAEKLVNDDVENMEGAIIGAAVMLGGLMFGSKEKDKKQLDLSDDEVDNEAHLEDIRDETEAHHQLKETTVKTLEDEDEGGSVVMPGMATPSSWLGGLRVNIAGKLADHQQCGGRYGTFDIEEAEDDEDKPLV